MSLIHKTAHGLSAGQPIMFANVVPDDTGIDETVVYYVIADGLTADDFKFSDTPEGTEFTLAFDITDGAIVGEPTYEALGSETQPDATEWVTHRDIEPPAIPGGLRTTAAVNGMFVGWNVSTARDLAYYELRYAPDDGTGTGPDTAEWTTLRSKTTAAYIGNLPADTNGDNLPDSRYWFQVRAVDITGNVSAWQADEVTIAAATNIITTPTEHGFLEDDLVGFEALVGGTGLDEETGYYVIADSLAATTLKVSETPGGSEVDITVDYTSATIHGQPVYRDFLAEPEQGWCLAVSGDPVLVSTEDVEYQSIGIEHIKAIGLSAEVIKTGVLNVNTTDANMIDGIKVYDDGVLIGLWNDTGLYIYSSTDADDYIRLFEGGLSVFQDGVELAAITPDGINASALFFGDMPGGHNVILNSGFELAAFGTGATEADWNVQADFDATDVSVTNLTHNAGNITATTLAF